jgi:DnaJ-class molecular chaperone
VLCEIPVSFSQAALGAQVDVPTLDGKVKMRVPEGTQSGRLLPPARQGHPARPVRNAPRGDQHVRNRRRDADLVDAAPAAISSRSWRRESGDETAIGYPRKRSFLRQGARSSSTCDPREPRFRRVSNMQRGMQSR